MQPVIEVVAAGRGVVRRGDGARRVGELGRVQSGGVGLRQGHDGISGERDRDVDGRAVVLRGRRAEVQCRIVGHIVAEDAESVFIEELGVAGARQLIIIDNGANAARVGAAVGNNALLGNDTGCIGLRRVGRSVVFIPGGEVGIRGGEDVARCTILDGALAAVDARAGKQHGVAIPQADFTRTIVDEHGRRG